MATKGAMVHRLAVAARDQKLYVAELAALLEIPEDALPQPPRRTRVGEMQRVYDAEYQTALILALLRHERARRANG